MSLLTVHVFLSSFGQDGNLKGVFLPIQPKLTEETLSSSCLGILWNFQPADKVLQNLKIEESEVLNTEPEFSKPPPLLTPNNTMVMLCHVSFKKQTKVLVFATFCTVFL